MNLKKYKEQLRKEFFYQCAYCGLRESEGGGAKNFHIDHYRPKTKFSELEKEYSNLIYACGPCNRYKSDYWPNYLERILRKYILNPRYMRFSDHIETTHFYWVGKTAQGRYTIERLRLNNDSLVQIREDRFYLESMISKAQEKKTELLAIQVCIPQEDKDKQLKIARQIEVLESEISVLERKIGPMD